METAIKSSTNSAVLHEHTEAPSWQKKLQQSFETRQNQTHKELPKSAQAFDAWNSYEGIAYQVPSFTELVKHKLLESQTIIKILEERGMKHTDLLAVSDTQVENIAEILLGVYERLLEEYRSVTNSEVPIYVQSFDVIEGKIATIADVYEVPEQEVPEIFHGRDAINWYYARLGETSGRWSDEVQQQKIRYILSSRSLQESPFYTRYIAEQEIPPHSLHLDTGWRGRGPLSILKQNNQHIEGAEYDQVFLLGSEDTDIESLHVDQETVNKIEYRITPLTADPIFVEEDGKVKAITEPTTTENGLLLWAGNQACYRAFLPQKPVWNFFH